MSDITREELLERLKKLPKKLQEEASKLIPEAEPERLKKAKKSVAVSKIKPSEDSSMARFIKETEGKEYRKV